jgi:hypothetical protein
MAFAFFMCSVQTSVVFIDAMELFDGGYGE